MVKAKIGLEAEFFLLNKDREAVVVPSYWERDSFPILGEIRGDPGEDTAEVISSFVKAKIKVLSRLDKGAAIEMANMRNIRLKTYRAAMREMDQPKNESLGKVRNIYGIDLDEFSDQIIKGGKIQGINASCGLHIHFSASDVVERKVSTEQYELVQLPISLMLGGKTVAAKKDDGAFNDPILAGAASLLTPVISLYRHTGYKEEEILKAEASVLTWPVIEWIVRKLDEKFFDRFAPPEKERTKFRQKGFYELKPYGFEYRSLPANPATMEALPEIVDFCLGLLKELKVSWPKAEKKKK